MWVVYPVHNYIHPGSQYDTTLLTASDVKAILYSKLKALTAIKESDFEDSMKSDNVNGIDPIVASFQEPVSQRSRPIASIRVQNSDGIYVSYPNVAAIFGICIALFGLLKCIKYIR